MCISYFAPVPGCRVLIWDTFFILYLKGSSGAADRRGGMRYKGTEGVPLTHEKIPVAGQRSELYFFISTGTNKNERTAP
jgi:hypothetical protein